MTHSKTIIKNEIAGSRNRLYRVALAWCSDPMLAEDLVHETITSGIDKSHQLRDTKQLYAWLYSILNNKWYRYLQKRKEHVNLDENIACENSGPDENCHDLQLASQVREAITKLPHVERQVISLVDLDELSYIEVAKVLEIPIGTVMSRLHRARKNLLEKVTALSCQADIRRQHLHRVK